MSGNYIDDSEWHKLIVKSIIDKDSIPEDYKLITYKIILFYIEQMMDRLLKRLERERKMGGSTMPLDIVSTPEFRSFKKKINNNPIFIKIKTIDIIFENAAQIALEKLNALKKDTN